MTLQNVHLRINDAATGQPTSVRLRVTDAVGAYCPPFGRPAEFTHGANEDVGGNLLLGRDRWTYIDGTCELALPPGDITIEARKGPEYRPLRHTLVLPLGKLALRLAVERWTDLRAEGWYSGDTRAHFLPPHAALLEAAAEDLAVVNLLAGETTVASRDGHTYPAYPNLLAFSGQQPCLERDGHLVAVNTHNTHPTLGRLGLLHCHRVVYPLTFGGPEGTDDWSLEDWCQQCHRKRGLVVWTDAFDPKPGHAGEALADLILGHIDALELDPDSPYRLRAWYQLLNAGLRVPIVGASAKTSNRTPLGALRTYARLPADTTFSYTAWIDAVRAGRTFVTAGPVLRFTVDGSDPGATLDRPADAPPLRLAAEAAGTEPFERVELLANAEVVASGSGRIEREHALPDGGWLAARCWGHGCVLAHTSPVYVRVSGRLPPVDETAIAALVGHLERGRDWLEREGRFSSAKARDHLLAIFDAARQALLARSGPSGTIDTPAPPA
jgi:hypothetical protein